MDAARAAQGVRRWESGGAEGKMCGPGGAAALGSPYGGAGERSETERAQAVQIWENAVIVTGYPLSHDIFSIYATAYTLSVTAFSRDSSPIGRAKGRALPAQRTEITTWFNQQRRG